MRDEARAASYHADTADAERKAMYDVAQALAAMLEGLVRLHPGNGERHLGTCHIYRNEPSVCDPRCVAARAALEAWKKVAG